MKSIKSKLWLIITSLVIFILILVWVFQVLLLNKFYIVERKNTMIDESKIINELYLEALEKGKFTSIARTLNYLRSNNQIHSFFVIVDTNGKVVYPSDFDSRTGKERFGDIHLSILDNDGKEISYIVYTNENKKSPIKKALVVSTPVFNSEKEYIARSVLISNLLPIRETSNILKKQLSIITFISVIIGSLLALFLAKEFTNPIIKITEATKKIAKGKFETRVDVKSKDEIGVLGKDVNDMAQQLGNIEELRKDFISNVSHELKTPIGIIRAYAELIRDINDEETKADNVSIIVDESIRLNEMVEDILTLSKMESGYDKLNIENINLSTLIEDVLKRLEMLIEKKSINILLDYEDDQEIMCDYNKMFQVFYNIINNSINHSDENSEIIIKTSNNEDKNIVIEIKDQGIGIPKSEIKHIWDRFYKVEKSRKRNESGTGLGMAIVKNILDLHGFNVEVESIVGVGTVVRILI